MLALTVLASWALIVLAMLALWIIWGILSLVFDLLERWYESRRASSPRPKTWGS